MSQKKVLLVEDEEPQRDALHRGLEKRGFWVASAADKATARRLVEQRKEPFDVVVLDMNLKDPEGITGGDLGIEFRKRKEWQDWPAEYLICSAHDDKEYYKLAMELGAAAYLEKSKDFDLHTVFRHVRVLALRRALSVDRPDALAAIDSIAKSSSTKEEAVRRFCQETLFTELVDNLGTPFLLLATDGTGTYGYNNQTSLPDGPHKAYETVQALTQGITGASDLFVFPERLDKPASQEESVVFKRLRDAVFIPLLGEKDLRLSLGILPGPKRISGDEPRALASVLAAFFRPTVLKHLLTLTTKFTELYVHRLAVLTATSQLCLYVGQEQLTLLEEAAATSDVTESSSSLKELHLLAEDLREAGEILGELAQQESARTGAARPAQETPAKNLVSMRAIVQSAWGQTSRMLAIESQGVFRLEEGDCRVRGRREYLEIATSRVLQWFIQRLQVATPTSQPEPSIVVTCRETAAGTEVIFEDHSRKLSKRLREYLFVPFSQAVHLPLNKTDLHGPGLHLPLYMAKALVELGNGGLLEDQTPEEGETGNRLVMRFPASPAVEANPIVN